MDIVFEDKIDNGVLTEGVIRDLLLFYEFVYLIRCVVAGVDAIFLKNVLLVQDFHYFPDKLPKLAIEVIFYCVVCSRSSKIKRLLINCLPSWQIPGYFRPFITVLHML